MFKSVKGQGAGQQDAEESVAQAGGDSLTMSAIVEPGSSGQLGDSSWLLNDSAYDGTGLRVLSASSEPIGALSEVPEVTRYAASDDGSDSDVTALAPRPPVNDTETGSEQLQTLSEPGVASDDLETPSLATATMRSMPFPLSASKPADLSTFLSSTISSPKTRSQSSSSLASFPIDLTSDASAIDTDDAISELNSEAGDQDAWSIASISGSTSQLVMPHMLADIGSCGASDRTSSSSGRDAAASTSRRAEHEAAGEAYRSLIICADGSRKRKMKVMLGQRSSRRRASRASSSSVKQDSSIAPDTFTASSTVPLEVVPDLKMAYERVLQPFETLKSLLQPDLKAAEANLVDSVLPFLLENAAVVHTCFWLIKPNQHVTLAQHVSENYSELRKLCKIVTVFPVITYDLLSVDVDPASQLVQGDLELFGIGRDGKMANLRKRAKVLILQAHKRENSELLLALSQADLRSRTLGLYRKWSSPSASAAIRPMLRRPDPSGNSASRPASQGGLSTSSESRLSGITSSRSSSSLASPGLPEGVMSIAASTWHRLAGSTCSSGYLDPLNPSSLLRLVGLQLADTFTSLRRWFITPRPCSSSKSQESGEDSNMLGRRLANEALANPDHSGSPRNTAGSRDGYGPLVSMWDWVTCQSRLSLVALAIGVALVMY